MQQQRRGGFSPPASVTRAIGRGKPAPTLLLQLIFKRQYSVRPEFMVWSYQTNETYIDSTTFRFNSVLDRAGRIQAVPGRRRARRDQLVAVARPRGDRGFFRDQRSDRMGR